MTSIRPEYLLHASIPQILVIVFMKLVASAGTQVPAVTISTDMVQEPPHYPIIAVCFTLCIEGACITTGPGANPEYCRAQSVFCELRVRPRLLGIPILRSKALAAAPQVFIVDGYSFSLGQGQWLHGKSTSVMVSGQRTFMAPYSS